LRDLQRRHFQPPSQEETGSRVSRWQHKLSSPRLHRATAGDEPDTSGTGTDAGSHNAGAST
jgi:hypothetical protein